MSWDKSRSYSISSSINDIDIRIVDWEKWKIETKNTSFSHLRNEKHDFEILVDLDQSGEWDITDLYYESADEAVRHVEEAFL